MSSAALSGAARARVRPVRTPRVPLRITLVALLVTLVALALSVTGVAATSALRSYLLGQQDDALPSVLAQAQRDPYVVHACATGGTRPIAAEVRKERRVRCGDI